MFPQHRTLHASIAGYQDGVEFVPGVSTSTSTFPPMLHLVGWAFHWKRAACPVRYCRQQDDDGAAAGSGSGSVFTHALTMRERADVYAFYSRYAVLRCGWDERLVLPQGTTAEDCPVQWLEMEVRPGEWVRFRDLVRFLDEDEADEAGRPAAVVSSGAEAV